MVPAVRPKEWNTGSTLNTLSRRSKSMRAAAWRGIRQHVAVGQHDALRRAFEPEVNRITAGSSGLALHQRLAL